MARVLSAGATTSLTEARRMRLNLLGRGLIRARRECGTASENEATPGLAPSWRVVRRSHEG
jgi:hypothetical protein